MTVPLWIAFLLFCIGAVAGWLIHVEYLALKEEEKTDQDYMDEQFKVYEKWRKERAIAKHLMEEL